MTAHALLIKLFLLSLILSTIYASTSSLITAPTCTSLTSASSPAASLITNHHKNVLIQQRSLSLKEQEKRLAEIEKALERRTKELLKKEKELQEKERRILEKEQKQLEREEKFEKWLEEQQRKKEKEESQDKYPSETATTSTKTITTTASTTSSRLSQPTTQKKKYGKHQEQSEQYNDKTSDDSDTYESSSADDTYPSYNSNSASASTATTTAITATSSSSETPTIYSQAGNRDNSAKQQNSSRRQQPHNHQITDPNDTSGISPDMGPDYADHQHQKDESPHQKSGKTTTIVFSVLGSVAAVCLIVGGFVVGRVVGRRRGRKAAEKKNMQQVQQQYSDLETGHHDDNDSGSSSSSDHTTTQQNPFLDPEQQDPQVLNRMLASQAGYMDYRVNRTLSMMSQTTATMVLPSAPPAKELDALECDNPFEDYTDADPVTITAAATNELQQHSAHQRHISNTSLQSILTELAPNKQDQEASRRQQQTEQRSIAEDYPPPPAYTPNAAPSAPPLYALPSPTATVFSNTEQTVIEPRQSFSSNNSSRRHSISSCHSIESTTYRRPVSLRRASGTLTHVPSINAPTTTTPSSL